MAKIKRRRLVSAISVGVVLLVGTGIGVASAVGSSGTDTESTTASPTTAGSDVATTGTIGDGTVSSVTGVVLQQLTDQARSAAALNGDASPTAATIVPTTRSKVDALFENSTGQDQGVYVVAIEGNFTVNLLPRPPQAPAPKVKVLIFVVDPATGEATDIYGRNSLPDLAQLGTPTNVDLASQ